MLKKVLSGCQTGADQGGLLAAWHAGLDTGGFVPRDCMTEDGAEPAFVLQYGLTETDGGYPQRTRQNVHAADGTALFVCKRSPGSDLTRRECSRQRRNLFEVSVGRDGDYLYLADPASGPGRMAEWIACFGVATLNVAGHRESACPGIHQFVYHYMREVFRVLRMRKKLETSR